MKEGPARVLESLRSTGGGPCSGEFLSSELGVTRAQIWKHVEALRKRGYRIDGEPGGGYRLLAVPDRLYPEELQCGLHTRWLAQEIHYFEEVDSTNRVALELGRAGAPHGAVVVAEAQSAGRGRLGRSFFSPAGLNLYTTALLRPRLSIAEAPGLILASAWATAETVAATVGPLADTVEIKWPNDVLIGGLKTSGILVELAAEATRIDFAALGVGVNLNVKRESFPDEFRHLATSIASATGKRVERAAFARSLYERLEEVIELLEGEGFAGVRPRFLSRFRMPGRPVRVIQGDGSELAGRVRGIGPDGALELIDRDGRTHSVIAGDVTLAKEQTP